MYSGNLKGSEDGALVVVGSVIMEELFEGGFGLSVEALSLRVEICELPSISACGIVPRIVVPTRCISIIPVVIIALVTLKSSLLPEELDDGVWILGSEKRTRELGQVQ